MQLFTGGLPEAIRVYVELQAPQDLQGAMALARAYERQATVAPPASAPRPPRPPPRQKPTMVPSASPVATQPLTLALAPSPPARQLRRLSPAEMAERRRQGLCYNCDEPYVRGHKWQRLFFLEMTDFVDDAPNLLDDPPP